MPAIEIVGAPPTFTVLGIARLKLVGSRLGSLSFFFFGRGGLHAYTVEGTPLWSRDLGRFEGPWGTAACPILVDDLVVQNCDADADASAEYQQERGRHTEARREDGGQRRQQEARDRREDKVCVAHAEGGAPLSPVALSSASSASAIAWRVSRWRLNMARATSRSS